MPVEYKSPISDIQARLDAVEAMPAGSAQGFICTDISSFKQVSPQNIHQSVDLVMDDPVTESPNITRSATSDSFTVSGTPAFVDISVTVPIEIDPAQNNQRPNQIMRVVRSDGEVIAASATGYIRDTSGHDKSSHTIATTDAAPIADGSYAVRFDRESGPTLPVMSIVDGTRLTIKLYEDTRTP